MLEVYEISSPLYKRVDIADVTVNRDYLVRKVDSNNRAVAAIRVRVNEIRGIPYFERMMNAYLSEEKRARAYTNYETNIMDNGRRLGFDVFA